MRVRILASIALMIGFYTLAVGLAVGLLAAVYAEFAYGNEVYLRPTIFAVVTAGVILWSILPRWDKFLPPGPRLESSSQPELFDLVRGVARDTSQEMPAEVYLVPNVNAFVTYRGGIMGVGSRRVMGIGLPLLQALTTSELRAVMAHEFGHYAGGDLNLGGWIYKTRQAMSRTIVNLAKTSRYVHKPFVVYGNLFMRVTQAIAQAQEIAADRMAMRIGGAASHARALTKVHRAAVAFGAYWSGEVLPVLRGGYRPPIANGFRQFLQSPGIASAVDKNLEDELSEGKSDPYDSHPPLKERLAAIGASVVTGESDEPLAITLMHDLPRLEQELLLSLASDRGSAAALQSIEWHDTPLAVFLPQWRRSARELADVAAAATASEVPMLVHSRDVKRALALPPVTNDQHEGMLRGAVAALVAVRLVDDGWACTTSPGEQIVFTKDGRSFEPFGEVIRIGTDKDQWVARCTDAGIASMRLRA